MEVIYNSYTATSMQGRDIDYLTTNLGKGINASGLVKHHKIQCQPNGTQDPTIV